MISQLCLEVQDLAMTCRLHKAYDMTWLAPNHMVMYKCIRTISYLFYIFNYDDQWQVSSKQHTWALKNTSANGYKEIIIPWDCHGMPHYQNCNRRQYWYIRQLASRWGSSLRRCWDHIHSWGHQGNGNGAPHPVSQLHCRSPFWWVQPPWIERLKLALFERFDFFVLQQNIQGGTKGGYIFSGGHKRCKM